MEIGEIIWKLVSDWKFFEKDTIGKQLVRAADSIAANLSEGFGRFHYKDSRNFVYYARGSLFETKSWITKAYSRKLISEENYRKIKNEINTLGISINHFLNSIGKSNDQKNQ